jgi:hypothetical protein
MRMEYQELVEGLLDENSVSDFKTLIRLDEEEGDEEIYSNQYFTNKENFLKGLLAHESRQPNTSLYEDEPYTEKKYPLGTDIVILRGWKNVENISARLIDSYNDAVILECLIDKELGVYEERRFNKSLFQDYDISTGSLYLIRIFERKNELRMEVHNDPELTLKDDFPPLNFVENFKNSRLFRKK